MATATHTFVKLDFIESDGTIDKEEFELAQDVKPIGVTVTKKEVNVP